MRKARIFFIAIGIFYLLNLASTLPFSTRDLLHTMYPNVDLGVGRPVFTILQDAWAVVGLQLGAIGLVALWGAREPLRYAAVVPVVIATEVVDGIWDFYSIVWSYEAIWLGSITLALHFLWIGWGLVAWHALKPKS